MLVLHANWTDGALHLWGEGLDAYHEVRAAQSNSTDLAGGTATEIRMRVHPFAITAQDLRDALARVGVNGAIHALADSTLRLRLPSDSTGPWPSERLGRAAGTVDHAVDPWLGEFEVATVMMPPSHALRTLMALDEDRLSLGVELSQSVRYWNDVARFVIDLLADQRFIPTLAPNQVGVGATASWQPWLGDEQARARVAALLSSMPPAVRAIGDRHLTPWMILQDALRLMTDGFVREALQAESFIDAIVDRDAASDSHVAWLSGLLAGDGAIQSPPERRFELVREIGQWVSRLDDTGQGKPFHLCLRLNEPAPVVESNGKQRDKNGPQWMLSLHLQSAEDELVMIDAASLWIRDSGGVVNGHRIDHPQELLLSELARASRVYPRLESALEDRAPQAIALSTGEAYEFLRDIKPVLEEAGVGVIAPAWWDQPMGRLAARLQVDPMEDAGDPSRDMASNGVSSPVSVLGLNTLVQFRWQVAVGDQPLSVDEFKSLMNSGDPLVQVRGRWMEISPDQMVAARNLLAANPSGQMTLLQAIHLAHGAQSRQLGVPVTGMDASGWIADVLGASSDPQKMLRLDQPQSFIGELRPYQRSGLSWMAFLDQYGLGACLADDMGLGKTIQLIALLLHERAVVAGTNVIVPPTLLVVPTSVVGNWSRELARFAPTIKVHVHHGPERALGDSFAAAARAHDVVVTTYPLVARDAPSLQPVKWHRVALDEAQYIKNPPTKQTMAIRALHAPRRLALTGTPVENRLSELWSIMDFCNPGYLGPASEFRRRFSLAIERRRDPQQAEQLKRLVRPFILRRVKTDPTVINDLPPCVETKEYATLTAEQAALYQQVVNSMLGEINRSEGIQRRGLVLSALVRLKQICNHPAQGTSAVDEPASPDLGDAALKALSRRSGKAQRLMTMLEEVLATGEKALIFTQFRQMGHLLTAMIQHELDCEVQFLHGGTPSSKRQHMIDRFQGHESVAGSPNVPFFVLSLKAGGLGLNLTAANHVFHFDRWWNPAVENQATDRAFRIGQTRTVHVHKFVCVGTLEERIDQMIESKTELATNIIGAGEQWLTELSSSQLHELLTLRQSALEVES